MIEDIQSLEELSSGQRVILLEKVHDTSGEIGHVLADHEGQMAGLNLFVVDDVVSNLIASPTRVSKISKRVFSSCEHSDGHISDIRELIQGSLSLSSDDISVVISENLEAILFQVLSVMQDGLDRSTIRLMTHVNGEAVTIIKSWVLRNKETLDELAQSGDTVAEKLASCACKPVSSKHLMNAKNVAGIV